MPLSLFHASLPRNGKPGPSPALGLDAPFGFANKVEQTRPRRIHIPNSGLIPGCQQIVMHRIMGRQDTPCL